MAESKTQLANLALARIGENSIIDINDTTNDAARQCKLHLEPVVREVARRHKWNFLKKRAQLPANTTGPAFEWEYSYTQPTDCVRVVKVNGYDSTSDYIQDLYEIEGRDILTNAEECKISYIAYTDDVTIFDPLFDRAVVTLLASYLASIIAGDLQKATTLRQEFEDITLPNAQIEDSKEEKPRRYSRIANSRWLQSRRIQPNE